MTDIQPWENEQPLAAFTPGIDLKRWAEEFRDIYRIAEALCKTPFVPREMLGHQADVAAAIMKGRELGLSPFDALGSLYIVHGRVGMYADFMRRRILQAGHIFKIIESTDNRCVVEGVRKDSGQTHRASFTLEQARKAGIDLGKYPADKLIARATSRLCKQAFPDVLAGSLIAEDLIDGLIPTDDEPAALPATQPAGPAVQRKRATRAPKAARTQPKPAPPPTQQDDDELAELLDDQDDDPAGSRGSGAKTPDITPPHDPAPNTDTEPAGSRSALDTPMRDPAPQTLGPPWPNEAEPPTTTELEPKPRTSPQPMTRKQSDTIFALNNELGVGPRTDRLAILSYILGREILTSKELTLNDASTIIDTIKNWQTDDEYPMQDRIREILNQATLNEAGG